MHPDYSTLAEQYGGFLVAIGGVSITVLTLVLAAWRIQRQPDKAPNPNAGRGESTGESEAANNRPALVISLIIATFCSFVGAQLMAEMVALPDLVGETHFLLASVNIFIAVIVVIFAVMLLATEYRKENLDLKGVRRVSRFVFFAVLLSVLSWMAYSVIWRMPAPHPWRTPLGALAGVLILFFSVRYRLRKNKKDFNESLLWTFGAVILFTVLSLVGFLVSLLITIGPVFKDLTVGFFVLAITFTCLCLWSSARLVGREKGEGRIGPPQGRLQARTDQPSLYRSHSRQAKSRRLRNGYAFQIGYEQTKGREICKPCPSAFLRF